jgi:hypothetical protein
MLGGSLLAHQVQQFRAWESGLFDITITIALHQVHAKDLSTTIERLTGVIAPKLVRDRASFHINAKPAVDELDLQPSLCFPERDAAWSIPITYDSAELSFLAEDSVSAMDLLLLTEWTVKYR